MSQKRERPPSLSPPPLMSMPWMSYRNKESKNADPSKIGVTVNLPARSQLLQNTDRIKPSTSLTEGEKSRLDTANIIRYVLKVKYTGCPSGTVKNCIYTQLITIFNLKLATFSHSLGYFKAIFFYSQIILKNV